MARRLRSGYYTESRVWLWSCPDTRGLPCCCTGRDDGLLCDIGEDKMKLSGINRSTAFIQRPTDGLPSRRIPIKWLALRLPKIYVGQSKERQRGCQKHAGQICQETVSQGKTASGQGCQTNRSILKPSTLASVKVKLLEFSVGHWLKMPSPHMLDTGHVQHVYLAPGAAYRVPLKNGFYIFRAQIHPVDPGYKLVLRGVADLYIPNKDTHPVIGAIGVLHTSSQR